MKARKLSTKDLPLGPAIPDHPYNLHVKRGIEMLDEEKALSAEEIREIAQLRRDIWAKIQAMKDRSMKEYSRHVGRGYGLKFNEQGQLLFEWKREGYKRIGYESDYYAGDSKTKTLQPFHLDPKRPRIIVFATGRAFAERNARLRHLTPEEAMENARHIMSAQSHLVRSRLVPDTGPSGPQVAALAYDMVTSELETPAIRIQYNLDHSFIHPVSMPTAERLFGQLIAEADFEPRGYFVRKNGKICGKLRPDDELLNNLNNIVLVGASVGCLFTIHAVVCLGKLIQQLGGSSDLLDQVMSHILIINFGPTVHLSVHPQMNHLAMVNKFDEFVFAGQNAAPVIAKAEATGRCLVPNRDAKGHAPAKDLTLVFQGPSTAYEGPEGWVFAPDGSHFGHSLTHYSNELRDRGFGHVLKRVFETSGPFNLGEIIESVEAEGNAVLELRKPPSPSSPKRWGGSLRRTLLSMD